MTKDEIFAVIRNAGLMAVPVSREGDRDEVLDYYDGDLKSFLTAAKETGAKAILVMNHLLSEDQFYYGFDDDPTQDPSDPEADLHEVDLTQFSPVLEKYKRRLGEVYYFFLMAKGGVVDLCFSFDQDWVEEFEKELERAEGLALLARRKNR